MHEALLGHKARLNQQSSGNINITFDRSGTRSYINGGLMVCEGLALRVEMYRRTDEDEQPQLSAATYVDYHLANEFSEDWDIKEDGAEIIEGRTSGPFTPLGFRVSYDLQRALDDPVRFIVETAQKVQDPTSTEAIAGKIQAAVSSI
jgi:hypothetical protein